MSDSTESPVAVAPRAGMSAASSAGVFPIQAVELIRLAQGLYFVFFGVLLASVVAAQIVILLWLRTLAEVLLAMGIAAVLAGSWRLRQARLGAEWGRQTARLLGWGVVTAYFCVIFYMWRKAPLSGYLQVNAALFVVSGLAYLLALSRVLRVLAEVLGRRDLMGEAKWFGGAVAVLMLGPFLALVVWVGVQSWRANENALLQFQDLMALVSTPVLLVVLLPLSLMLGLSWAVKDAVLARLQSLGGE